MTSSPVCMYLRTIPPTHDTETWMAYSRAAAYRLTTGPFFYKNVYGYISHTSPFICHTSFPCFPYLQPIDLQRKITTINTHFTLSQSFSGIVSQHQSQPLLISTASIEVSQVCHSKPIYNTAVFILTLLSNSMHF